MDLSSRHLKSAVHKGSRIKVAFFDIDGTIYRADHTVSKNTVNALTALKSRGIKVCLATGRPYFGARRIIKELSISDGSIFFSGALAINPFSGEEIYTATIEADQLLALSEAINSSGLYLEYYSTDKYYVEGTNHITEMHNTYLHQAPVVTALNHILKTGPFFKLVAISETPEQAEKMRQIAEQFSQFAYGFSTGATHPNILFMNVTSPHASREKVFDVMLDHFTVTSEEVISFGDAESDLPFMLRSGIGVALENAPHSVKEKAPYLTGSVEKDGVVEALQILGLI